MNFFTRAALIRTKTLSEDALRKMRDTVIALCRGGTLTGKRQTFQFETHDQTRTQGHVGTESARTVRFSETEWRGIQADIRQGYSQCVRALTPRFIEKLSG